MCTRVKSISLSWLSALMLLTTPGFSQTAFFADGYHGGYYGHYPKGQTSFMINKLGKHPHWRINLEIEPVTWDWVKETDSIGYASFKSMLHNSKGARIEFVNPTYAQPYMYNISGESIIRQFQYGIKKMKEHFPNVCFSTYSSEEPCYTSALPQILKSFGFQYAVLKTPNTCWGGYTREYGGEIVKWIGPDGTEIKTVPRYSCEMAKKNSTWQTIAFDNSELFIDTCFSIGIKHPVGMCYQDAMWDRGPWDRGPWLEGIIRDYYQPTKYITWNEYFTQIADTTQMQDWKINQEDFRVSLMWGSQILQKIAQQVRYTENNIVRLEKLTALAKFRDDISWPTKQLDNAWKNLLLAQHHDAWIVSYGKPAHSEHRWDHEVSQWTLTANTICDSLLSSAVFPGDRHPSSGGGTILVWNTSLWERTEVVKITLPIKNQELNILDDRRRKVPFQILQAGVDSTTIIFPCQVKPTSSRVYFLGKPTSLKKMNDVKSLAGFQTDSTLVIESSLYRIVLDPQKGGVITSLRDKVNGNSELATTQGEYYLNELRGHFYDVNQFQSSSHKKAQIKIIINGPLETTVEVHGTIGPHSFVQRITVGVDNPLIDFETQIYWAPNPRIGRSDFTTNWYLNDRSFYDDQYKLQVLFPLQGDYQRLDKNAPFDVVRSNHLDTFFDCWDSIKHNIILNWVDVTDETNDRGLALFTDHTTSYAHGKNHPLGLVLQSSGKGLWGIDYPVTQTLRVNYAIMPHAGDWTHGKVWPANASWNEPLYARFDSFQNSRSTLPLISSSSDCIDLTALIFEGDSLKLRLFNASDKKQQVKFNLSNQFEKVSKRQLNGNKVKDVLTRRHTIGQEFELTFNPFEIITLQAGKIVE